MKNYLLKNMYKLSTYSVKYTWIWRTMINRLRYASIVGKYCRKLMQIVMIKFYWSFKKILDGTNFKEETTLQLLRAILTF